MEKTIDLFRKSTDQEIIKSDLAFLVDKVNVLKGEPQVHGTQYRVHDNEIHFFDTQEPKSVDQRREELGLESLEEYKKKVKRMG